MPESLGKLVRMLSTGVRRIGLYRSRKLGNVPGLTLKIDEAVRKLHEEPIDVASPAHVVKLPGVRNWLVIFGRRRRIRTKFVIFPRASGNLVIIGSGSDDPAEARFEGSDNVVLIGDEVPWCAVRVRCISSEAIISLGRASIFNGTEMVAEGDGCGVEIGAEGLFAPGTTIRTSDLHGIYDIASGEWLNRPAPVVIEPRVWVGQNALILKGVRIGGGAIVGAGSVVSKDLPRYSASAGIPAKPIRTGVSWSLSRDAMPEEHPENNEKILRWREN